MNITENAAARTLPPYTLQEVLSLEAAQRAFTAITTCPFYAPTPLRSLAKTADTLNLGAIWYKDEGSRFNLGSFKVLGGAYAVVLLLQRHLSIRLNRPISLRNLATLRDQARYITVTCATDGNHGRAVAAGAQAFGCNCVIFLPGHVSAHREQAIRAHDAAIIRLSGNYDDAVREARRAAEQNDWYLVSDTSRPGYETIPRDIMQGYTVMLIETLQQLKGERPTHVLVQGGVGGLAAAVCAHLWEALGPDAPITMVVEPDRADCLYQSALVGEPTPASGDLSTIMAGLSCGEVSTEAWRILSAGAHFFMTIPDDLAIEAMRTLARDYAITAGESATAGLAALTAVAADPTLRNQFQLTPASNVLLIGSEGATDPDLYSRLVPKSPLPLAAGDRGEGSNSRS
jgi:diaminopropionate ammonia-lyase